MPLNRSVNGDGPTLDREFRRKASPAMERDRHCATVAGPPRGWRWCKARTGSVSSPRFPQLWKTLWKSGSLKWIPWFFLDFSSFSSTSLKSHAPELRRFLALFAQDRNERQHLGPDPHQDRKK